MVNIPYGIIIGWAVFWLFLVFLMMRYLHYQDNPHRRAHRCKNCGALCIYNKEQSVYECLHCSYVSGR